MPFQTMPFKAQLKPYETQNSRSKVRSRAAKIERYNRIFSGGYGCGFFDWDLEREHINWYGHLWKELGYSDNDLIRISSAKKFHRYVHKDDLEKLDNNVHIALKGLQAKHFEIRILKKNGDYIWIECRMLSDPNSDQRVHYLSGLIFDIDINKKTEEALIQSEQRISRIIQSSYDGIWEWAISEAASSFSRGCWEHLGFTSDDEHYHEWLNSKTAWLKRMHPDDYNRVEAELFRHIEEKTPYDIEYRVQKKDGSWCWIRSRGNMSYNSENQPYVLSGLNIDVTELKTTQSEIIKAKEDAEKANQAKSVFLSSMSHELRTPLNAILGYSQLLQKNSNLHAYQQENLVEINNAGEHLLYLIGDVLDLAKIEVGHLSVNIELFNPLQLLDESVRLVGDQAVKKGIKINTSEWPELDFMIEADPLRFKQIIINLLSNAIKYNCENGQIKIEIKNNNNQSLWMGFHDTGAGIPIKKQNDIFSYFNRAGFESSNVEGAGIGLVIAKQLVEHMGGVIGFNSVENLGSCFWVEFPLYKCNSAEKNTNYRDDFSPNFDSQDSQIHSSEAHTILYIEDQQANQKLMELIFEHYPMLSLEVASDGYSGIFSSRQKKPSLIILDINLPEMNGYDIIKIIKQDPTTCDIPVIALSANAMSNEIEKAAKMGFDRYLTKPINIGTLTHVINDFLES